MTNIIVWGLAPDDTESWKEQLLAETCRTKDDVAKVMAAAGAAGFHSFRTSVFTDGDRPDFVAAVLGRKRRR